MKFLTSENSIEMNKKETKVNFGWTRVYFH